MEHAGQSLSDFLDTVQASIRNEFAGTYRIIAEIASVSGARHLYFELIEKGETDIKAKCRANLWQYNRYRVVSHFEALTRESLKPGMKVLMEVSVDFHTQYGFSLVIQDIDPSFSLGEFERIKAQTLSKLESNGLLEQNKMLSLPKVIQRIAIVSSAGAAGYQDFIEQLTHNQFGYIFNCQLFNALVQGADAANSMMQALDKIEKDKTGFDAIVVIRGGGSVIDLSCFDDFEFNYYLSQSSYPVITGIGHERDVSVADHVAHTHLKTPTAVADFLIEVNHQFDQEISEVFDDILAVANGVLQNVNAALTHMKTEIIQLSKDILKDQKHLLAQNLRELDFIARNRIVLEKNKISYAETSLRNLSRNRLKAEHQLLQLKESEIKASDPQQIINRGFSISYVKSKKKQLRSAVPGEIMVTLGKGYKIESTINTIDEEVNL